MQSGDPMRTRTLRLRFELGLFDNPSTGPFSAYSVTKDVDTTAHRALARTSASESLVLLRNAGGLLPLDPSTLNHIALIGPNANNSAALLSNYAGCGASQTRNAVNRNDAGNKPCRLVTPLQGLQLQLPSHVKLSYVEGSTLNQTLEGGEQAACNAAAAADAAQLSCHLLAQALSLLALLPFTPRCDRRQLQSPRARPWLGTSLSPRWLCRYCPTKSP